MREERNVRSERREKAPQYAVERVAKRVEEPKDDFKIVEKIAKPVDGITEKKAKPVTY